MVSVKQEAFYFCLSSDTQGCITRSLKIWFHTCSPYSVLFFLLARSTSRNASVLSTSVACMEGTASSTGKTPFLMPNATIFPAQQEV